MYLCQRKKKFEYSRFDFRSFCNVVSLEDKLLLSLSSIDFLVWLMKVDHIRSKMSMRSALVDFLISVMYLLFHVLVYWTYCVMPQNSHPAIVMVMRRMAAQITCLPHRLWKMKELKDPKAVVQMASVHMKSYRMEKLTPMWRHHRTEWWER